MILKPCSSATAYFVLILVTLSTAQKTGSAVEQFQCLQAKLRASHKANDWHSNLVIASKLKEFLNEAPDSLLEVARADAHVGDLNAVFYEMAQFVRMGQSTDLLATSPEFAALVKDVDFTKIQSGMAANRVAILLGSTAFLLWDPGLLAEDVDYDPRAKRFFITSVREKKIISTEPGGASTDFAPAFSLLALARIAFLSSAFSNPQIDVPVKRCIFPTTCVSFLLKGYVGVLVHVR